MLPTDALATIGPWDFGDTGSANDAIAAWREQNRSAVVEKARRALQSRAIGSVVRVPDIFFPILEESGSTSDELLTDLFARLLTNHLDPSTSGRVHRIFARVLGQMSPTDAVVLLALDQDKQPRAEALTVKWLEQARRGQLPINDIPKQFTPEHVLSLVRSRIGDNVSLEAVEASLGNLSRLGLCSDDSFLRDHIISSRAGWRMSLFAHRLLSACADSNGDWHDRLAGVLGRKVADID